MDKLLKLLEKDEAVTKLNLNNSTVISLDNSIEALLIASSFYNNPKKLVIVVNSLYNATRLYDRLNDLLDYENIYLFPSDESFLLESLASNKEYIYQRINVLNKISNLNNYILILHTASLVRYLPSKELFNKNRISLKIGDIIKPTDLVKLLIDNGYEYYSHISSPLQYSIRGGVIDIYSINNDNPIRIEFFDDEIESIRYFDIDSQLTISKTNSVDIISASDLIIDSSNIDKLIDKLNSKKNGTLIDSEIDYEISLLNTSLPYYLIYKYYKDLNPDYSSILDYIKDSKIILIDKDGIIDNFDLISSDNKDKESLYFNILDIIRNFKDISYINRIKTKDNQIEFKVMDAPSINGNYKTFDAIIKEYLNKKYKIILCIDNKSQFDCIEQYCKESNFTYSDYSLNKNTDIYYSFKPLKEGFELTNYKILYLSSHEIFGVKNKSSQFYVKYKSSSELSNIDSLVIGDYVVHEDYGIGQFEGIEILETNGIHKDYLKLKYGNNSNVFIPVESFKSVRKYVGRDGVSPKLSNIGSKEWIHTKEKIKKRLEELTKDLMNLYLNRTKEIGFAFQKDEEYQKEFENAFPYDLTIDQQNSLNEIKNDMEKPLPMDRLLCGDVGFGKTELAFRAAFKAIVNHKQVALLCPTTVLAMQHYKVALERFKNFPVSIELVSRLVTSSKLKKIYERIEKGQVDFIIGTHKLLSKDIKYKDLGLLIVDEEQRFGVEHKEKIKRLKNGVDVLTLSATPIPRTMQSSLVGIRSMSQIETPISNRLAVQTYVLERNLNLAKEIIQRELSRNGQIFYIHNNIDTIYALESKLYELLPNIKIAIIHGRMNKDEIEDRMMDFVKGDVDLLLSTTIIENGIDIPNANTIIIDEADRFGLSQLYQLKGRVGRSEKLGYCYLFYNPNKQMNENAIKRLKAIKEFSELGSGYKIALRDLTIRGAGDLLGKEQAGFIDCIGIDMYLNMLQEAIDKNNNPNIIEEKDVTKDFKLDAYIPEKFTNEYLDKIDIYKKISNLKKFEELVKYKDNLNDMYGKLPKEVELLLEKRRLELYIKEDVIDDIIEKSVEYEVVLTEKSSQINNIGVEIFDIVNKISKDMLLTYKENKIRIIISKKDDKWLEHANLLLLRLKELFSRY